MAHAVYAVVLAMLALALPADAQEAKPCSLTSTDEADVDSGGARLSTPCPADTYHSQGSCTSCPAGRFTGDGSTSIDDCACPGNTFPVNEGRVVAEDCSAEDAAPCAAWVSDGTAAPCEAAGACTYTEGVLLPSRLSCDELEAAHGGSWATPANFGSDQVCGESDAGFAEDGGTLCYGGEVSGGADTPIDG